MKVNPKTINGENKGTGNRRQTSKGPHLFIQEPKDFTYIIRDSPQTGKDLNYQE